MSKYPPTTGEVALAEASITIGGVTARLTELGHSIPLVNVFPGDNRSPAVRVFRKDRGPWLEEPAATEDDAQRRSRRIDRVLRWANGTAWPVGCCECGEVSDGCFAQEVTRRLVTLRLCHSCDYWRRILHGIETEPPRLPRGAVINGRYYVVKPWSTQEARFRGFYGMEKTVRWLDGMEVKSNDLWNGSEVPGHFRDRLPDTAEFASR